MLRQRIWNEPDLSGDFIVDETGAVVLPMLGERRVAGVPADVLRRTLTEAYARNLRTPAIEFTLLRRITVLGAVRTPGLYPVDLTVSVSDAIAVAGGLLPDADPGRVELLREGRRLGSSLTADARIGASPIRTGDQIFVAQRSWVSRNAAVVASAGGALLTAVALLVRR